MRPILFVSWMHPASAMIYQLSAFLVMMPLSSFGSPSEVRQVARRPEAEKSTAKMTLRSRHATRSLPGVPRDTAFGTHYSGYLNVDKGLEIFYYYVPHPDASMPLVVWMNGGPGASSVSGLFTEIGPFLLNGRSIPDPSKGKTWQLFANPHGWHQEASLLVWEQPAGVGFSRCRADECGVWNDTTATEANLRFLLAFFEGFPAERARKFFIVGESYAGIYVPLLAERVLRHNEVAPDAARIQLHGIAVGNGCIGYAVDGACGTDSLELFVEVLERAAPRISRDALGDVRASCRGELAAGLRPDQLSIECQPAMVRLFEAAGEYNEYHLGSPCGPDGGGNWGDGTGFSCGASSALAKYLASGEVQCALHAIPCGTEPRHWQQWDGDSTLYNITEADTQPAYRRLLAAGVRVLIYNGLRDTVVPAIGAEKWVPRVAGAALAEPRRPWGAADGSLVGNVVAYASGLTFATLEGAGHLVPADRPREARAMVSAWLKGEQLPPYTGAKCKRLWLGRGYGGGPAFCGGDIPGGTHRDLVAV